MVIRVGEVQMKYIKYLLIFCLCMCVNSFDTKALSCSNSVTKDLGQIASYVKLNYEIIDNSENKKLKVGDSETTYLVPNFVFEISIYNITDEIFITIEDEERDTSFNVTKYDTKDETYTFKNHDFGEIYHYKIIIKSAHEECYGQTIRTINFTKPKYNPYSEYTYCKNSSTFYCQRFIESETGIKNTNDFLKKIKANNDINNPDRDEIEERENLKNMFKDNWKLYAGIFVFVIITLVVGIILLRKHQKKKGWKL